MNRAKQTRMTKQKALILDILRNTKSHPTADWIYEQARKSIPDISLGTVYRNLNVLKDLGEILELNFGSHSSRFDGTAENHYHFVCEACGNIMDLELSLEDELNALLHRESNLKVLSHRLEFYGLCPNCDVKEAVQ